MKVPYTKSGKCGDTVWQLNRYGQIYYQAFIQFNPNSPAQIIVRVIFANVSARWRTLSQQQRDVWIAVARTKWSKWRLTRGRLTGFNYFVQINVALANRGLAQVDLPPENPRLSKVPASSRACPSRFDQSPVGPSLYLRANQLIAARDDAPRKSAAAVPPPT